MITIHPEFDGQWFWKSDDGELFEAPSLRLLKAKLGKGYRIRGYYPNGYGKKVHWPEERVKFELPVVAEKPQPPIEPPPPVKIKKKGGGVRRYDHETILDLWEQGWTAPQIATKLGMPVWHRVGQIVVTYRERGDPRAKPRARRTDDDRWQFTKTVPEESS